MTRTLLGLPIAVLFGCAASALEGQSGPDNSAHGHGKAYFNVNILYRLNAPYRGIYGLERYLYTGLGSSLFILDVTDISRPTAPVAVGPGLPLPCPPEAIYVANGLAYIADGTAGLLIVDVTVPSSPTLRGSYNTLGYARDVEVLDGFAYVADRERGLQIIDVSDPSLPRLRGAYDTPGEAHDVSVWGSAACVADSTTLQIIDIRNRSSPSLAAVYDPPGVIHNVCVRDNIAYVNTSVVRWVQYVPGGLWHARYTYCLYLVDITNRAFPRVLGSYGPLPEDGGRGGDIAISGNWIYVIMQGIRFLDIRTFALYGFVEADGTYGLYDDVFAKDHILYHAYDHGAPDHGWLNIIEFTGAPASARRWEMYR